MRRVAARSSAVSARTFPRILGHLTLLPHLAVVSLLLTVCYATAQNAPLQGRIRELGNASTKHEYEPATAEQDN